MRSQDFTKEIKRKSFHLLALLFPIIYLFVPKLLMILLTLIGVSLPVYIDISRHYNKKVQVLVNLFLTPFMRVGEENGNFRLSGVTYMMAGICCSVIFFSKPIAILSLFVLVLADSNAALIGKKVQGAELVDGKTVAGSCAFFLTAFMIALVAQVFCSVGITFLAIIVASIGATLVELYSGRIGINDNLSIPLCFGALLTVVSLV